VEPDPYTTIKVFRSDKDILDRLKFQISGQILRSITQGETLRILVGMAERNPDLVIEIAKEIL
jgi:hypothetical protein